MNKYEIIINGMIMGIYEGETEDEALDNLAKDAGYEDSQDMINSYPDSIAIGDGTEIDSIEDNIEIQSI